MLSKHVRRMATIFPMFSTTGFGAATQAILMPGAKVKAKE